MPLTKSKVKIIQQALRRSYLAFDVFLDEVVLALVV